MTPRGLRANSVLALAGDAASKLGALVVVLVGARALTVSDFAVLATALAIAGILTIALDLGVGTVITRDGARSRVERGRLVAATLVARVPLFALVLVAAPLVGAAVGRTWTGLATALLAGAGAVTLTVLGCFRSCQDMRPEALQRLVAGALGTVAVIVVARVSPDVDVLLLALAAVGVLTIVPLALRIRVVADVAWPAHSLEALRRAAPIGLLALATVAYYRSGTIVLAALSSASATAAFAVASGIAFALLMLPNAVTTALLPRLAASDTSDAVECTRRALAWTTGLAAVVACGSAIVVPAVLPIALGADYAAAGAPFVVLCLGIPVIAASGIVGTALLSAGRVGVLGAQVGISLSVNIACLFALVPLAGAVGAALATFACELVGLIFLLLSARTALPGLFRLPGRSGPAIEARPVAP